MRFRPLSELEIRRGEKEKSKDFLKTVGSQIKITNPRPPPGQEAKSEEYAFDTLYTSDDTTSKVFKDLAQVEMPSRALALTSATRSHLPTSSSHHHRHLTTSTTTCSPDLHLLRLRSSAARPPPRRGLQRHDLRLRPDRLWQDAQHDGQLE